MNPSRFLHPFPLYPSSRSLDVGGGTVGGGVTRGDDSGGGGGGGGGSDGGGGSYDTAGDSNVPVDAAVAWLDDLSLSPRTLCERPLESSVTIASV
ncbi:hypothetical protein HZH68_004580 [Vespula germanica]|uniref:Uncharacterized protein n=1 Tax=Vespula germanica TaxID=30212 RepID=A0A834KLL3_VESGE|nr:hypothetical protein HZH68_004580 [Vespula germanica]